MSPSSELAARLEAEAVFFENIGKVPGNPEAKQWGEDLRAAAQAVREREWRPIAEAPKDGTEILTWVGGVAEPFKYICRWSDSYSIHGLGGNWTDGLCNMGIEVTQWMPLPAPPEVGG